MVSEMHGWISTAPSVTIRAVRRVSNDERRQNRIWAITVRRHAASLIGGHAARRRE